MTEPQTWTTIGVLAAALLGTITLVVTMLNRTLTAQFHSLDVKIDGLRKEISGQLSGQHTEIGSLRHEVGVQISSLRNEMVTGFDGLRAEMNARFEAVDTRFTNLDRDVQVLSERVFRAE